MPFPILGKKAWGTTASRNLYRIRDWSGGYFDINEAGNIGVTPSGRHASSSIDLLDIVSRIRGERDLKPPLVLRFPDILRSRIATLVGEFDDAINAFGYGGKYQGCFPVKVNQQREVFEEITNFALESGHEYGLEVGTKSELLAALAETKNREAPLVCNGYKDAELIDLALYGLKAGINVVLVLERAAELDLILKRSKRLRIRPNLGIRVRVSSEGAGKWASTAGGKGLFGLNAYEMVDAIDTLREHDMLDCLTMLHYHQGSQIPDLSAVTKGVEEVASVYIELLSEGAALDTINVGGGLAIDYDGSGIAGPMSKNYTLRQYARTIVSVLNDFANANGIPAPNIISESGRAITSHYSVLVFEILRTEEITSHDHSVEKRETHCKPLLHLRQLAEDFPCDIPFATGDLAVKLLTECGQYFSDGRICMRELAEAQRLQLIIFSRVVAETSSEWIDARDLLNRAQYADYYYGNFSLFQSMPDAWAIDQVFPIMPIHRLDERPSRSGVVADITCDCDGKIKNYVDKWDELPSVPLHELQPNEPYYIGAFLVGSYQETLGDFHNLLGRPTVATVREGADGELDIETIPGDSASWMLEHVRFDSNSLKRKISELAFLAFGEGRITKEERDRLVQTYEKSLAGSSYLSYE